MGFGHRDVQNFDPEQNHKRQALTKY